MEKKELIFTVAKDIFLVAKISISDVDPAKRGESVGRSFAALVKEVEKAYDSIAAPQ